MQNTDLTEVFNPLPCRHQFNITSQILPTIDLLRTLNEKHPDILKDNHIDPQDYHNGLVFRSAIESIRGSYIASSTPGRERFVKSILSGLKDKKLIHDFDQLSSSERWDFEVFINSDQSYLAVIEVKGGEGNSINISVRSRLVKEFGVWSHLDGSLQHHPSKSVKAVINRLTNELSARGKQVDMLFIKDILCGTRARPCPKYPGRETEIGLLTCPDMFLFPQRVPTLDDPEPPVHTLETLKIPKLLLSHYDILAKDYDAHIWYVHLKLVKRDNRLQRIFEVKHKGQTLVRGRGKLFSQADQ